MMNNIQCLRVKPGDLKSFQLIAQWYLEQWQIPEATTIQRLETITADSHQFQLLMMQGDVPVATGGIYNHVGILDKIPRLNIYQHWLALVYTLPSHRNKGLGAILCNKLEQLAKEKNFPQLYLFTDTAESLYLRLGWIVLERIVIGPRNIAIMQKNL